MRRTWLISALLCLAIVGGAVAYKLWPRTVPLTECSEVYRR